MLQVRDDSGAIDQATIDEVLAWREWTERDRIKIFAVANGDLRRFSTNRNGAPCDIEPAETAND